jgi:hypothetical protein
VSFENKVGMFIPELEVGDFLKRTLGIHTGQINPCNHNYPGMGRGVAE